MQGGFPPQGFQQGPPQGFQQQGSSARVKRSGSGTSGPMLSHLNQ
jgi:hypothetical protein